MSRTSKSPRTVRLIALDVARRALPEYAHRCSPKKFTQHQRSVCLVLKPFYRTDDRGVEAMLAEWSDLQAAIGLRDVPHFTTLQETAAHLLVRRKAKCLLEKGDRFICFVLFRLRLETRHQLVPWSRPQATRRVRFPPSGTTTPEGGTKWI